MLTVRFLACRSSQRSIMDSFQIDKNSATRIVSDTCQAISTFIQDKYMAVPKD